MRIASSQGIMPTRDILDLVFVLCSHGDWPVWHQTWAYIGWTDQRVAVLGHVWPGLCAAFYSTSKKLSKD